eukprot:g5780.t1
MAAKLSLAFDSSETRAEALLSKRLEQNDIADSIRSNPTFRPEACSVADFYEVDRTIKVIKSQGFQMVALQFPDDLLPDAPKVVQELQLRSSENVQFIVLGDTQYGSCSVDEVSAQHLPVDFIVHYGNAYLNPSRVLPVQYIFGKLLIDIPYFVETMKSNYSESDRVVIFCEAPFFHSMKEAQKILKKSHPNVVFAQLSVDENGFINREIKSSVVRSSDTFQQKKRKMKCSQAKSCCSKKENTDTCCSVQDSNFNSSSTQAFSSLVNEDKENVKMVSHVSEGESTFLFNGLFGDEVSDSSDEEGEAEIQERLLGKDVQIGHGKEKNLTKDEISTTEALVVTEEEEEEELESGNRQHFGIFSFGGFHFEIPCNDNDECNGIDDYDCVYIGEAGEQLSNLIIHFHRNKWFTFKKNETNATWSLESYSLSVDRFLMKRYFVVEKIRKAKIIGLLAGTLAVDGFLEAMQRAKSLIESSGRKCYSFVVGKLNVPKLANFMEIDVFVLVAAPEYSFLSGADSSEFVKPLATPYELEVALNPNTEWTGDYITDFQQLLSQKSEKKDSTNEKKEDFQIETEKVVKEEISAEKQLISFGSRALVEYSSPAGDFLQNREYTGLEVRAGETEIAKITKGLDGIASCFESELERQNSDI